MTPLESALGCHDILATIFDHLIPGRGYEVTDDLRDSCHRALAFSAVTCSTISHHALNALWRELDSIRPLLKILPNFKCVDGEYVSQSISPRWFFRVMSGIIEALWRNNA